MKRKNTGNADYVKNGLLLLKTFVFFVIKEKSIQIPDEQTTGGTKEDRIMRCLICKTVIKSPKGQTRETQKCGICRGVIHGAKKRTSRYADH